MPDSTPVPNCAAALYRPSTLAADTRCINHAMRRYHPYPPPHPLVVGPSDLVHNNMHAAQCHTALNLNSIPVPAFTRIVTVFRPSTMAADARRVDHAMRRYHPHIKPSLAGEF